MFSISSLSDLSLPALASGFLVAGFLGSWHCGIMCGPVACFVSNKKQLLPYQLGRMVSYTLAGAIAGTLSQFLLKSAVWLKYVSVTVLCVFLILMFFKPGLRFQTPKALDHMYFKFKNSGFLLGLFTVFLPCGWLYTFIISATASGSAWAGALVMFLFWLSSLPALSVAQLALKRIIEKSDLQSQKIANIVLLLASLISLIGFVV